MFELIEYSDSERTKRNLYFWAILISFVLITHFFSKYLHRDVMMVVVVPLFIFIGTSDYWKRMNKYSPSRFWVIIRIIPPITIAVSGWYQLESFFWISMIGSAVVLVELEIYLKRRTKDRERSAEMDEVKA